MVLALGIGLGVWGSQWWGQRDSSANLAESSATAAPAPTTTSKVKVEVAAVDSVRLERVISAVGTLRSHDSVMLRPEVSGRISEINFTEGGKVKKGQVLVRLDDSVAKAKVQQARACWILSPLGMY